jgi:hypothetical protein
MLDKRIYISIFVLICYSTGFNFYLWELFYGSWYSVNAKGFYYLLTILTLIWLNIDKKLTNSSHLNKDFHSITEYAVIINFIIIMLTLYNIINIPLLYFFIYNGSVLVTTLIVLVIGTKHGIFKK